MGYLDNTSQQLYYQGNNLGNYQFVSLKDVINQFMIVYVGEDKIIPSARRLDVAFHAQRALAELSFDTFKSFKSQEIEVPSTLQMLLPHDYVNYTKISWVDSSGIKHPIYPTKHTSNPFDVNQNADGTYTFPTNASVGVNLDFEDPLIHPWQLHTPESLDNIGASTKHFVYTNGTDQSGGLTYFADEISIAGTTNALTFKQHVWQSHAHNRSFHYCVWQAIDVSQMASITLQATGTAEGASTNILGGTVTVGISHTAPSPDTIPYSNSSVYTPNEGWFDPDGSSNTFLTTYAGDPAGLKWTPGETSVIKYLQDDDSIDVSAHNTVYLVITSVSDFTTSSPAPNFHTNTIFATLFATNTVDDIFITSPTGSLPLSTNATNTSSTWDNYKSTTPSENNNDDYEDDIYWPYDGRRYGLEPSHAQMNGSFYIDQLRGKIHFSSNISGKTIILDYISDGLGTEDEMQVHKLAEEAMYKWITYAILSSRSNIPAYTIQRFKKEKFAETRKAKLRLSNIKLEELSQILRGKSKHIKH